MLYEATIDSSEGRMGLGLPSVTTLSREILSIDHGNYRDGSETAPIRSKAAANAVKCDGLRNCRRQEGIRVGSYVRFDIRV